MDEIKEASELGAREAFDPPKEKTIAVVIPAHNEERNIGMVIETMPEFVHRIIIVDDCSKDQTAAIVEEHAKRDPRILLIRHEHNEGPGGAMVTGYKWARDNGVDIVALMAGDGQTAPEDLRPLLAPVLRGEVDYAKGNRLVHAEAKSAIPKVRLIGNAVLSFLTKIASGYWQIVDSQSGYTAMNRTALCVIDWDKVYKHYGWPNDLLVRLNVHNMRVGDVPIQPVYGVGEKSGMKISTAAPRISGLLTRMFLWRMWHKYILRSFHPLVLFYFLSFLFFCVTCVFFVRIIIVWIQHGYAPALSVLAFLFSVATALQTAFFAMWMDMEDNRRLNVNLPPLKSA